MGIRLFDSRQGPQSIFEEFDKNEGEGNRVAHGGLIAWFFSGLRFPIVKHEGNGTTSSVLARPYDPVGGTCGEKPFSLWKALERCGRCRWGAETHLCSIT